MDERTKILIDIKFWVIMYVIAFLIYVGFMTGMAITIKQELEKLNGESKAQESSITTRNG